MSFAAAAAFLGPMVVPALTGAAIGAGTGLLTGDGFSDDDWWQNALMGLGSGALMGAMGPAGGSSKLSGMLGEKSMIGGQLGADLSKGGFEGLGGGSWDSFWNNVTAGGEYIGTNPAFKPDAGMFEAFSGLMPSQDTLTKGLLGSQVFGAMRPEDGQQQQQQQRPQAPTPNFARMGNSAGLPYRQPLQVSSLFGQRKPFMAGRYS